MLNLGKSLYTKLDLLKPSLTLNINQVNPGLSNAPKPVIVEFSPSGKKVKAYLGQNIGMIAQAAGVDIKYNCKKGSRVNKFITK